MQKCRFIIVLFILMLMMTACSRSVTPNKEATDSSHTDINSFGSQKTEKADAEEANIEEADAEEIDIEEADTEEIDIEEADTEEEQKQSEEGAVKMKLEIGDQIFTAVLEENSSVDALKELLADGALTLNMTDYAGMEKGADLGTALPQNNVQMNTQAGDIILYQGKTFVIYYDTNSWSLTPIGKIENVDAEKLRRALGTGDVTVTVSLE